MENAVFEYNFKDALSRMQNRRKELVKLKIENGLEPVKGLADIKISKKRNTPINKNTKENSK